MFDVINSPVHSAEADHLNSSCFHVATLLAYASDDRLAPAFVQGVAASDG